MNICSHSFHIDGLQVFEPKVMLDSRGFFYESFSLKRVRELIGSSYNFVQDNHSLSTQCYTVRGLHCQAPPKAQGKLVRCTAGRLLDIAVDARKGSKTYGEHVAIELSARNMKQFWIPPGFLHGFITLAPDTEVQYKCTDYYAKETEFTVLWNDPSLNIDWNIPDAQVSISTKDKAGIPFNEFGTPFSFD